MSSFLKCVFRNCFEKEREDEDEDETSNHSAVEAQGHIPITSNDDICNTAPSPVETCYGNPPLQNAESLSSSMWSRFRMKSGSARVSNEGKESNVSFLPLSAIRSSDDTALARRAHTFPLDRWHRQSAVLKEAHSFEFDPSDQVPALPGRDQFILPGSEIQRQMAELMKRRRPFAEEGGEECVICMDIFTPDNPRMPTLCGCGENKAIFHLPCLYQWVEKSRNCPSCRKRLMWEEF